MALGTGAGWAVFTNMFSYQTELADMSQCPFQLPWPWPTEGEQKWHTSLPGGLVMKWACFLTFSPHPRGQRRESWSLQRPRAKLPDQNHLHWSGLWDRKKSLPVKHRDLKAYLLPQLEQILTNTLTSTDFFKHKPYKQFMSSSFPGINRTKLFDGRFVRVPWLPCSTVCNRWATLK